jgi:hypothetical protein
MLSRGKMKKGDDVAVDDDVMRWEPVCHKTK